jgi:hypothetical protein
MNPRRIDHLVELGRNAAKEKLPQLVALLAAVPAERGPGVRQERLDVATGIS